MCVPCDICMCMCIYASARYMRDTYIHTYIHAHVCVQKTHMPVNRSVHTRRHKYVRMHMGISSTQERMHIEAYPCMYVCIYIYNTRTQVCVYVYERLE